jgi:hypothetical protein
MTELSAPKIPTHELVGELLDVCGWLADGQSTAEEFRRTVVAYEARKLTRFGYTLQSGVASTGLVQFSLRITSTGELAASLEVNAATGEAELQKAWI